MPGVNARQRLGPRSLRQCPQGFQGIPENVYKYKYLLLPHLSNSKTTADDSRERREFVGSFNAKNTALYCTHDCLASAVTTRHGTAPTQPVQAPNHDPRYTGLLPNIGQNKGCPTAAHGTMTPPPGPVGRAGGIAQPPDTPQRPPRHAATGRAELKAVAGLVGGASAVTAMAVIDPVNMSNKKRKFRTGKFDKRIKRQF